MSAVRPTVNRLVPLCGLLLAAAVAACSSDSTGATLPGPLAGLSESSPRDSVGGTPPEHPVTGEGQVRGTVLGPSLPGSGNDSLQTAPRIANARITAYLVTGQDPITIGASAASVTTDAEGRFMLPVLPAGLYAVTVEPPAPSIYVGQYILGEVHSESINFPWWIVLAKK